MLSYCIPFFLYIEKEVSQENLYDIYSFLERNNYIMKTLFIKCLLLLWELPRHESLFITIFYSPFLRDFF